MKPITHYQSMSLMLFTSAWNVSLDTLHQSSRSFKDVNSVTKYAGVIWVVLQPSVHCPTQLSEYKDEEKICAIVLMS